MRRAGHGARYANGLHQANAATRPLNDGGGEGIPPARPSKSPGSANGGRRWTGSSSAGPERPLDDGVLARRGLVDAVRLRPTAPAWAPTRRWLKPEPVAGLRDDPAGQAVHDLHQGQHGASWSGRFSATASSRRALAASPWPPGESRRKAALRGHWDVPSLRRSWQARTPHAGTGEGAAGARCIPVRPGTRPTARALVGAPDRAPTFQALRPHPTWRSETPRRSCLARAHSPILCDPAHFRRGPRAPRLGRSVRMR